MMSEVSINIINITAIYGRYINLLIYVDIMVEQLLYKIDICILCIL